MLPPGAARAPGGDPPVARPNPNKCLDFSFRRRKGYFCCLFLPFLPFGGSARLIFYHAHAHQRHFIPLTLCSGIFLPGTNTECQRPVCEPTPNARHSRRIIHASMMVSRLKRESLQAAIKFPLRDWSLTGRGSQRTWCVCMEVARRLLWLFFGRTGRHCTVERSFANAEGEETGHLLACKLLGGRGGQGQATVGVRVALES